MTDCEDWDPIIPDRCVGCKEGWILEYDTGDCVRHCSDEYTYNPKIEMCIARCE